MLVFLVAALLLPTTIFAQSGPKVTFGNGTFKIGNNVIPFGVASSEYQQFYIADKFKANLKNPVTIRTITFQANPSLTNGPVSVTASINMAIVPFSTGCMPCNLASGFAVNVQPVYAGTVTAMLDTSQGKNDFVFNLSAPYTFTAATGYLLVDITVVSTTGNVEGFDFGPSADTFRLYTNLLGQLTQDNAGLLTVFTLGNK